MRQVIIVVLSFLALGMICVQAISSTKNAFSVNNQVVVNACQWLRNQQNPKTGLIRSYDMPGDMTAWTYDQAVGIIALTAVGNIETASECADAMLGIRDKQYKAWVDAYNSQTKEVIAKSIAVGPNAWMGIALLRLYLSVGDKKYLSAAEQVAAFMLKLQVKNGKAVGFVSGGYNVSSELFDWTSTEHNSDFIAFMAGLCEVAGKKHYGQAALSAAKWLDREMWDPNLSCYHPGYINNKRLVISDFPERLDSQTWTILALHAVSRTKCGKEIPNLMHNGLSWIDQYLCAVSYEGKDLVGFSKITLGDRATPSFWAEGTAGYILVARLIEHNKENVKLTLDSLRTLQRSDRSVPYSVGVSFPEVTKQFSPTDLPVAHFEAHPNCLFGQIGVYGDGEPNWDAITKAEFKEPYSWYYEPGKPDYNKDNVHSGLQSFRLVNAGSMCASKTKGWASLGIDLGPMMNNKIKPLDVSDYQYLSFWAKTDNKDGAIVKVLFRDAEAKSYLPQATVSTVPPDLSNSWRQYAVNLSKVCRQVNLTKLVHIGFGFGKDAGNPPGTVIYLDDVAFTGFKGEIKKASHVPMPSVFPQHWPYGSVAATGWLIFVELNLNPFALN